MKKIQRLLCAVLCLGLVCTGAAAETTTSPKNNFYTYATQELAARHPADNEATLTDDELLFEGWTSLKDVENNVRAMILEDLEQISAQPLTAYAPGGAEYTLRQFVEWIDDREQVEAQGAEGMRPVIDMVMSCASTTDFMEMLGQLYVQTGHSPYYYIIYNNQEGASERYIHAYTLYYGLPELLTAEEYRQEAPHHLELLTKLFTLLGYEDEEAAQMEMCIRDRLTGVGAKNAP